MPTDYKLEAYLSALDRALRPLSISDRAEIVTEIKSHVLSALERNSEQPVDTLLAALGEPETVANRYLLERGQAPVKPPISPIVKWLVIGVLGTLALFLFFVGAMIWRFAPMVKVGDRGDHVSLMGGAFDFDFSGGNFHVHHLGRGNEVKGTWNLAAGEKREIQVNFGEAALEVSNSKGSAFTWTCKIVGDKKVSPTGGMGQSVVFDLTGIRAARCELGIPEKVALQIRGAAGKVEIDRPHFDLDLAMSAGKIEFGPDSDQNYKYDVSVGAGSRDEFKSSDQADAHRIRMNLSAGKIENREE